MHILYLHQYFVPPETHGGTRSYEFARRLIGAGHQVQMITSSAMLPKKLVPAGGRVQQIEIAGIPTVVIPVPYANEMGVAQRITAFVRFAVLASLEACRHPADVILATSTPLTIAIPGIIASYTRHVPMVFEVRDLWPELPIAVGALNNPILRGIAQLLEILAYRYSSYVIALSPGMAEGVIRRSKPPERVVVIPNSCDVEEFDLPAERGEPIRQRLPELAHGQPLVVYTGTFGRINGVAYLAEIAAAMRSIAPEVRFLLVGSGAERPLVEQQARVLGVLDKTLWIWEPIPKAEVPALLAAATIATSLFVPLEPMWNNSANKFFDALAAGKPVAINYGGWQATLLEQSGAGIVLPSSDAAEAARRLADFIHDPARLTKAAAAARNLAYNHFNRDMMARTLEGVLLQSVA